MSRILERIQNIGIVPVVKIENTDDILPMAKALKDGGIDCMEITFRSEYATTAIRDIVAHYPDMVIGAGTVTSVAYAQQAKDAGAMFIVTPGFNEEVVAWCVENNIPIIPGVQTASEIEAAMAFNLTTLKFFPAESSGGARKLKDFSGPYSGISFMPSGGINAANMHEYLQLPNVAAIGGSFMLPADEIAAGNWDHITQLTKEAIKHLLSYRLIHVGINHDNANDAEANAKLICELFGFTYYGKPKSHFAGEGFEFMNTMGRGKHGHIGIYTPYPERALYQLNKLGVHAIDDTITRNKKTNRINFAYLDREINGFAIHLINPDVKM
ncbi:bifunctional 4-hydroxy-2-oxoglutarate aldolase/2-dehydro-3-deoxy-phosphogluconate aldolase [Erysipelothrix sp. HDW6C]|uniref:bifunctional 4-hydroxy-2-oxoglutarate aldolase/2-dehydro-3-deoxy-phosphogluconate aldolase n=1 Tax=Erysipelothrix sp. HDW6C TaxID=2714930 RepID=UPI00140DD222|nr:bifunctional 4-hydroxy-2-oxoglutarate aldolase/2-dehydro-3-deoxy-phosphogluconate aldolase [Erysipelothrix sp. HDW6C]QIK69280.1 bifunctional 4-hydroxy-2-oxoglutarate aldolase/2-dehydro-3-deoxy-phosphogluconate aldolase [Erysipelothrix sp. HDW6C]